MNQTMQDDGDQPITANQYNQSVNMNGAGFLIGFFFVMMAVAIGRLITKPTEKKQ